MLVNLMPPVFESPVGGVTLREPVIVTAPAGPPRGFLVVHPRYRNWLAKCGVTTAAAALNLPGEIVSGHANRHVLHVAVKSGTGTRSLFLKREHAVSWRVRLKNWRAGFGRVSRSEREAKVLDRLERAGLPGPHWVAYGEDGAGRAFLLVDELTGYRELRAVLADTALSAADRGTLAARLGAALADLHAAGFDTPDLAAKHAFVRPGSFSVTVLDWQSSKPGKPLDTMARVQSLASLNASLVEWLATPRERLRTLRAYLRRTTQPRTAFAPFARAVVALSRTRLKRSSIRVQRQPGAIRHNQRLVWLAGEAVCATPEIAKHWPTPATAAPYYAADAADGDRLAVRLGDDRPATLVRFRTTAPLGRAWAWVRGRAWRSPAAKLARLLFHLQNTGVEGPQLYAFGQRPGNGGVDSFLVHGLPDTALPLEAWLARNVGDGDRLLAQLGALLRTAHDAGVTFGATPDAIRAIPSRGRAKLILDPTRGGTLLRDVSESQRVRDLAGLLRPFADPLRTQVLESYSNGTGAAARRFAARVRKQVAA